MLVNDIYYYYLVDSLSIAETLLLLEINTVKRRHEQDEKPSPSHPYERNLRVYNYTPPTTNTTVGVPTTVSQETKCLFVVETVHVTSNVCNT